MEGTVFYLKCPEGRICGKPKANHDKMGHSPVGEAIYRDPKIWWWGGEAGDVLLCGFTISTTW